MHANVMTKTTDSFWIMELNYFSITLDKRYNRRL